MNLKNRALEELQIKTNKKVKNANEIVYDNIIFKSNLELFCYKLLKAEKINFKYNEETCTLYQGCNLKKVIYYYSDKKNKNLKCIKDKKSGLRESIRPITYTPDFCIEIMTKSGIIAIFIETKGFSNDVYPYKRKLFFDAMERQVYHEKVYFFEPRNKIQVVNAIDIITKIINDENDR